MRSERTYNGVPISAILHPFSDNPDLVERIAHRRVLAPVTIVEPDPAWPSHFQFFKARIESALATPAPHATSTDDSDAPPPTILTINHIGSTSVPFLPAKPVIDIDLVLSSHAHPSDEAFYVARLEAAGFRFLLREPAWHGHRFFVWEPEDETLMPIACNLHLWGPLCPEVERHVIFRDYLRGEKGEADRRLYADTKREAAQ